MTQESQIVSPLTLLPASTRTFRISLSGRLYAQNASVLQARIQEAANLGSCHVVLECSQLEQIDSAGLSAAIAGLKLLRRHSPQNQIVFVSVKSHIRRVLSLTKIDQHFGVAETEAEALEKIEKSVAEKE